MAACSATFSLRYGSTTSQEVCSDGEDDSTGDWKSSDRLSFRSVPDFLNRFGRVSGVPANRLVVLVPNRGRPVQVVVCLDEVVVTHHWGFWRQSDKELLHALLQVRVVLRNITRGVDGG
ncbi:hypothetical protein WICPIJ_005766 [Wickerhamomyces pijperi]|uniref:Uncharacterized protein n=1 Tax=Wickerhamomyces pijperi TaxID=599730 RepID=A0A9P8TLJ3_WICPI|nr:hypothetical protein WICPIJ_005766 [Wickerhamomyces pijperi]